MFVDDADLMFVDDEAADLEFLLVTAEAIR